MTAIPKPHLILASASGIRSAMLRNAGLKFETAPAHIDEDTIRQALAAEGAAPHDLADALAEMKARKVSERYLNAVVIGCDQILEMNGRVFSKPKDLPEAKAQLTALRGQTHSLLSAAVVYENGQPHWRHTGKARLTMRSFSDEYLEDYLGRNWDSVRHSVGCYKLEEEGVRLFSRIDGDYFAVMGLPLIELLTWLGIRGEITT